MQRIYKENEWGKVSKRIVTIPPSILQGSQTWCIMGIVKTFTCCISLFFISDPSTPNYTLLSLLVVKLLFLSAVDNVVTILFMYSTSYFIAICNMGMVTLVPNSPLNSWEKDRDWIVEGLKGHWWCSVLMSECGSWLLLFNLMRWDGVSLEDEMDIRLVYGWNRYCHVFIWCHSYWCLRLSKHGECKG